ncbi:helix-turn-helix domain-containing protein [Salipaludibacillus keqinensis]|uniref:helix-turn-helix domain-containing protein n=1 Tax=Salipaludibacillus keqinensis TaxID=2045207 RepID=UPI0013049B41|nr:helix-turn-helix domain-containing protein [Salipaludibacillus keqinensis]
MSELGLRLKTAREEKGYSHEELQKITKIQKRYLLAIEEGDFSKMPGEFYGRAFVKSYCEAVGLDPEMVFEEHHDELPKPKREPTDLPPRVNRSKPKTVKKKSKMSSLIPTLIAILFIIAIATAFWFMRLDSGSDSAGVSREESQSSSEIDMIDSVNNNEEEENEPVINGNVDNNANSNENGTNEEPENENANNEEDEEPAEQTLSLEGTEGNRSTYNLSDAESFEVTMEFTGDSWLAITNGDGDELHQGTHSDGDQESFDFSEESEVTFNMGNVRTAELYVNEELLEYSSDDHRQYIIIQNSDS